MKKSKLLHPKNILSFFLTICVTCSFASCNKSSEVSSTADEFTPSKLDTLKISTDLEVSPYQDIELDMSAESPVQVYKDYYIYDKVYLTADSDHYTIGDEYFDYTVHNETDSQIGIGTDKFQLEVQIDDTWYVLPPVNFNLKEVYDCFPKGSFSERIRLSEIDIDYIPGTYRIIRVFDGAHGYIETNDNAELFEGKYFTHIEFVMKDKS